MQAWYGERNKLWDVLLRDAGKPRHGAILELRVVNSASAAGRSTELVVSVKNVCSRLVELGGCESWPYADVLVRDRAGRLARLTEEGLRYFSWQRVVTINTLLELKPGCAWGFIVPLGRCFKLADGGSYTVLARNYYDGDVNGELIASPVALEIGKEPATGTFEKGSQAQPAAICAENLAQGGATEKDWTRLLREAGQLQRGCILDAMMSPEEPTNLVASLTCLRISGGAAYTGDWEPGNGHWYSYGESADGRADSGRQPADYRVLVRDTDGKPVPLAPYGRRAIAAAGAERGSRLKQYAAIGAVIPLAKWFDMTRAGEYTVLVTLKAPDEKQRNRALNDLARRGYAVPSPEDEHGPLWVAKPIKVRIPAASK